MSQNDVIIIKQIRCDLWKRTADETEFVLDHLQNDEFSDCNAIAITLITVHLAVDFKCQWLFTTKKKIEDRCALLFQDAYRHRHVDAIFIAPSILSVPNLSSSFITLFLLIYHSEYFPTQRIDFVTIALARE